MVSSVVCLVSLLRSSAAHVGSDQPPASQSKHHRLKPLNVKQHPTVTCRRLDSFLTARGLYHKNGTADIQTKQKPPEMIRRIKNVPRRAVRRQVLNLLTQVGT